MAVVVEITCYHWDVMTSMSASPCTLLEVVVEKEGYRSLEHGQGGRYGERGRESC